MEEFLSSLILLLAGFVIALAVKAIKGWLAGGGRIEVPGTEPIEVVEFARMMRELARTAVRAAEQLGFSENLEELGVEALERGQKLGRAKLDWAFEWIQNELEKAGYGWVPVGTIRAYIEEAVLELARYAIVMVTEDEQGGAS